MEPHADSLRPDRPRIFGIGLNKTGTMTFDKAMTILGFASLHDGGPEVHGLVKAAIDDGAPLLANLDQRYDAFSDIGLLSRRFGILDRQYPGSRFVLTVRPVDEWIDSRRRHVERNRALREIGQYDGTFLEIDEERWRQEWDHHVDRVRTYFGDRPDFLEVDLTHDPRWGPLCELLGLDEPDQPFPWVNRGDAITIPGMGR
jgi:hypothetical protein